MFQLFLYSVLSAHSAGAPPRGQWPPACGPGPTCSAPKWPPPPGAVRVLGIFLGFAGGVGFPPSRPMPPWLWGGGGEKLGRESSPVAKQSWLTCWLQSVSQVSTQSKLAVSWVIPAVSTQQPRHSDSRFSIPDSINSELAYAVNWCPSIRCHRGANTPGRKGAAGRTPHRHPGGTRAVLGPAGAPSHSPDPPRQLRSFFPSQSFLLLAPHPRTSWSTDTNNLLFLIAPAPSVLSPLCYPNLSATSPRQNPFIRAQGPSSGGRVGGGRLEAFSALNFYWLDGEALVLTLRGAHPFFFWC